MHEFTIFFGPHFLYGYRWTVGAHGITFVQAVSILMIWHSSFFGDAGGYCWLDGKIQKGERASIIECGTIKKESDESSYCCSCTWCGKGTYIHSMYTSPRPNIQTNVLPLIWLRGNIFNTHPFCTFEVLWITYLRKKGSCWYNKLIVLILHALWPVINKCIK